MYSTTLQQPSEKCDKTTAENSSLAQHSGSTTCLQLQDNRPKSVAQRKENNLLSAAQVPVALIQKKANDTGLPDNLKSGIENLSGHSMDDVQVHYNSSNPAQLNAHAYAQGTDIHVAPGQEKHLPHEAWHVVQQKQGRVRPTMQMKGKVNINDDAGLEKEADVMGARALQLKQFTEHSTHSAQKVATSTIVQKVDLWGIAKSAMGVVGGAVAGTMKGGYQGYQEAGWQGMRTGAIKGLIEGGHEGYDRPGMAAEEIARVGGAIAGGVIGGTIGLRNGIKGAKKGVLYGGNVGYNNPALGLASAGGAIIGGIGGAISGGIIGGIPGGIAGGIAGSKKGAIAGGALGAVAVLGAGKINPAKTRIDYTPGYVNISGFESKTRSLHMVGKRMKARLNPADAVKGSATDTNWTWMQFLRKKYPKANIVRGHLLNHDLGGFGVPENLYPISTKANSEHSSQVEQSVKHLLADEIEKNKNGQGRFVNYAVDVMDHNNSPEEAIFRCTYYTDGQSPIVKQINSSLKDVGGFGGGKKDNPLDGSGWHHEKRKGEADGGYSAYLNSGHIRVRGKNIDNAVEKNVKAEYKNGGGLRRDALESLFSILNHTFFYHSPWETWIKNDVLDEMEMSKKNGFDRGVMRFVESTASYADNIGDPDAIFELIGQVIEDQLEKLNKKNPNNPDIQNCLSSTQKIMTFKL